MEQTKGNPGFTIFVPVKNGRNYIAPCVESILAQSYKNFDLVILGGYSTDGTCAWLSTLEARDNRIKVMFSDKELGIEGNWNRILTTPKREFMTIVGYDDLLDPDFLEIISGTIAEEPQSDLFLTHFRLIDSDGKLIRNCTPIPKYETAADFLAARLANIRDSFGTGYVMRSAKYDAIGGIQPYPDLLYADDALWLSFMRSRPKITSCRICFSYRFHTGSVSGSANPQAIIHGLSRYIDFLRDLQQENDELAYVAKTYLPSHVLGRCQDYYCHLQLNKSRLGREFENEVILVRELLSKAANGVMLDERCSHLFGRIRLRIRRWLGRIFRISRSILN